MILSDKFLWSEEDLIFVGKNNVLKHQAGQHDQTTHGSWAGEKLDEKRVALVKEVETIRSNWSQVVAVPTDIAIKILSGERYTNVFANKNLEDSQSRTKMQERLSREESVLGIPKDAPSSERPVYGYMADKNKKLVPNLIEEIGYGDVYFVLKPDVKNRSTMTMGDSIQVTGKAFPLTGKVTPQEIKNGYVSGDWNRGYFPFWEDYPETQISGGFSISDVSEIIVSPTFRSNTNEIGIIQQKSQDAGISFSSNVTKHLAGQHDQETHGSWAGDYGISHQNLGQDTYLVSAKDKNGQNIGHMRYRWDGTIENIFVNVENRRKGIATAMWDYAKKLSSNTGSPMPKHSDALTEDGASWAEIAKHLAGQHDQSTHGSWASDIFENVFDWADESMMMMGDFENDTEIETFLRGIESQQREAGYGEDPNTNRGSAVQFYVENGHKDINNQLREPSQPEKGYVTDKIEKIDSAINDAPLLKDPMIAYRGIANQGVMGSFFFSKLKVGDTFQDLGYVSTTLNPKIAASFAGGSHSGGEKLPVEKQGMVLQFNLPKGTKGLFLNPFIKGRGWKEFEFTLPRGSKFKVTQIRGKIIDVEIVQ